MRYQTMETLVDPKRALPPLERRRKASETIDRRLAIFEKLQEAFPTGGDPALAANLWMRAGEMALEGLTV